MTSGVPAGNVHSQSMMYGGLHGGVVSGASHAAPVQMVHNMVHPQGMIPVSSGGNRVIANNHHHQQQQQQHIICNSSQNILSSSVPSTQTGVPATCIIVNTNQQMCSQNNCSTNPSLSQIEKEKIYQLVMDLTQVSKREVALVDLSKKRESYPDLAPILWHSFGTIAALLQEIISIYPLLSPPNLTAPASNRVCNSLALLQCVASHPDTRQPFLNAHIPLFLYPFLNTVSKSRPFEYLRLTSLGVIGALVKVDDPDVINFLLQTEIIPLCLRIMETGTELSKTVGTFIVQKILLDDLGLNYICATAERFYAVSTVLSNMISSLVETPSARLLKHIIRCYLRLADNSRAREALRQCLPDSLKDKTFHGCLKEDNGTKRWLIQLLGCISENQNQMPNQSQLPSVTQHVIPS